MIKNILLFLAMGFMVGQISLNAQELGNVLTLQLNNQTLIEVKSLEESLNQLERVYNITLIYKSHLVEGKSSYINYVYGDDLSTALDKLLDPANLRYEQIGERSYILLPEEEAVSEFVLQETVRGQVSDGLSNETLPGVNLLIKGTNLGTATGGDGTFSLNVTSLQDTLVFSYVGYQTLEVPIDGRTDIDVALLPQALMGDDIVVIGYGTVAKSDLTGSVSSVRSEDIQSVSATSFDQALQGRAAGVTVTRTSGQPGGGTSIRIRGTSSINAGNEPLYVIDGMPVSGENLNAGATIGPSINALSSINTNDIESIEILKDASATAIYGSRGSNGVILITTKSGQTGRTEINFDANYGFQEITRTIPVLNAEQFATMINEGRTNVGQLPEFTDPASLGAGTNWQDEIFTGAPIQNYQISAMGGDEQTQFSVSGGYFHQDGIIRHSDFQRYSLRVNTNRKMNERFRVGNNVSVTRTSANGTLTNANALRPGITTAALFFNPILPVRNENVAGGYTFEDNRTQTLGNPVAEINTVDNIDQRTRILGNVFGEYDLDESLTLRASFGIDAGFHKENLFVPNFLKRTENANGDASVGTIHGLTWLSENTLSFNREIFGNNLNAVVGFTAEKFRSEGIRGGSADFDDNRTGWHNVGAGLEPRTAQSFESEWGILSYLGRINYSWDDRFLFTVTGRMDGASKFGADSKWGFFPSAAVAWRLSNEGFMDNVDIFSDLKLRTSYGTIGNQAIPSYQSLALIRPRSEGIFNNTEAYKGHEPINFPNPNLRWEQTQQFDVGIDATFLDDRITVTTDYYYKNTVNLLLSNPIPFTSGFNETLLNVGNMVNQGFEFDIQIRNATGAFSWSSGLNFSVNRNRVTNINQEDDIFLPGVQFTGVDGWSIVREGEPIGTFYGYISDGIFQTDEEAAESAVLIGQEQSAANPHSRAGAGSRKYRDMNGDGIIDADDRTIIGNAHPDFTWGFNNNLSYRNVNLSFFLVGSHGNDMVNFNRFNLDRLSGENNVREEAWVNRWTPDNPSNEYPRAQIAGSGNVDVNVFSTAQVEDASFIRLRNITLSYDLPFAVLEQLNLRRLRIFVSGTNLLTFTNYSGYDPEVSHFGDSSTQMGADYGGYPIAKTYNVGINIGL